MRVWRFDHASRRLLGAVTLGRGDRDPQAPERFLIPGDCTVLAPPENADPARLRFTGVDWQIDAAAPAPAWPELQSEARTALGVIDRLALACFKRGRPWPALWLSYEDALLTIVRASDGDAAAGLPPPPPDPLAGPRQTAAPRPRAKKPALRSED